MHAEPLHLPLALPELALRLSGAPGLCWLDGEAAHRDGRFSFLGAAPVERIHVPFGGGGDPLAAFDRMEPAAGTGADTSAAAELTPEQVPRWIGYVAYDAHHARYPRGARLPRPAERPVLSFARYAALIALDHDRGRAFLVGDDRAACRELALRVERSVAVAPSARVGAVSATDPALHERALNAALEHMARGDVYQVNLARCFRAPFEGAPIALFGPLRAASPVPFGFYYDDGTRVLLGRTMERFLRWERAARRLYTRPIKGTLPRPSAADALDDARAAERLRSDPKEHAEHAMIVDLMRNDLGRVAELGSVCLPELMVVEPYAGLSHLVSTVACRTRPGLRLRDVLEATFPPGSVTGAPKLRAIELIEALEATPRDAYTGAFGFVDRAGGLSLAVAIRTALCEAGELRYFAGGGIVEASQPARELAETELKAKVLFDALAGLQQHSMR